MAEIIVATESFVTESGAVVRKGMTFREGSPRLKGVSKDALKANFKPFEPDFDSVAEQATAAPAEKRKLKSKG